MTDKKDTMEFTPQQSHFAGGGDRRNKRGAEHYTDAHWHMSKSVSITTVLAFIVLLGSGITAYTNTVGDIRELHLAIDTTQQDLIRKTTVMEMFKIKDIEIAHLAEKIDDLSKEIEKTNQKIDESNHILQQILLAMPKDNS